MVMEYIVVAQTLAQGNGLPIAVDGGMQATIDHARPS